MLNGAVCHKRLYDDMEKDMAYANYIPDLKLIEGKYRQNVFHVLTENTCPIPKEKACLGCPNPVTRK